MKRISKAVREEAIELLLASADSGFPGRHYMSIFSSTSGYSHGAMGLADAVFGRAVDLDASVEHGEGLDRDQLEKLESAALLRDGWSPGDPVVRLKGGES